MLFVVSLSKSAERSLLKAPFHIQLKFSSWVRLIELKGLKIARASRGFRDEALLGKRLGQRSVRLNKQWRAIYRIMKNSVDFIEVQEITPHDY